MMERGFFMSPANVEKYKIFVKKLTMPQKLLVSLRYRAI
jgi:hypothetical protein